MSPMSSMSLVLIHIYILHSLLCSGIDSPVKYFFIGAIPEFIKSNVGSFSGIIDDPFIIWWSKLNLLDLKNYKNEYTMSSD